MFELLAGCPNPNLGHTTLANIYINKTNTALISEWLANEYKVLWDSQHNVREHVKKSSTNPLIS